MKAWISQVRPFEAKFRNTDRHIHLCSRSSEIVEKKLVNNAALNCVEPQWHTGLQIMDITGAKRVAQFRDSLERATGFDSWGQVVEAVDEYEKLAKVVVTHACAPILVWHTLWNITEYAVRWLTIFCTEHKEGVGRRAAGSLYG